MKCPECNTENIDAAADGHTEGPREYHAECWAKIEAQNLCDAINSYEGENVWNDVILDAYGYEKSATDIVEQGQSNAAVANGWIVRIDDDNRQRGWYVDRKFDASDWK